VVDLKLTTRSEEELDTSETVARSFDCDREVTTMQPLVSGQQLIAPDCVGAVGKTASFVRRKRSLLSTLVECDYHLRSMFGLQQACESIEDETPSPFVAESGEPATSVIDACASSQHATGTAHQKITPAHLERIRENSWPVSSHWPHLNARGSSCRAESHETPVDQLIAGQL